MEGEDEESESKSAFNNKPVWQRLIILAAGSIMNMVTALVIVFIIFIPQGFFASTQISGFAPEFAGQGPEMLMPGDKILAINNEPIFIASDIGIMLDRGKNAPYEVSVERDGKSMTVNLPPLSRIMVDNGSGEKSPAFGIGFVIKENGFIEKLQNTWLTSVDFVRIVKMSLFDLVTGKAGVNDLSGPVGVIGVMNQQAADKPIGIALANMFFLGALISANLAVLNMLPLPALDGGRIIFLLIELIRRKPVPAKYEGYIHAAGLVAFLALTVYVFFNDIVRLVTMSSGG